jgi:hypothetical protein
MKASLARFLAVPALVVGLLSLSARARAEEPAGFAPAAVAGGGFGVVGQWVLTIGANNQEYAFFHKQSGGGYQVSVRPSADYFLAPNLTIGGVLGIAHNSGAGTTDFDIGARAGFNINITGPVGFWPTAGIFANTHSDSPNHKTDTSASLVILAPFLYHIVPHLFVGFGPTFSLGLTGGGGNQYGLDALLGGWFS